MFLQNSIALTKCDIRMQKASCFLLQNAIVLLQIETVITKCVDFIMKCRSYYKMRHLWQNGSVMPIGLVCAIKPQGKGSQCYFNVSMFKLYFETYVISNMTCSTSTRSTCRITIYNILRLLLV